MKTFLWTLAGIIGATIFFLLGMIYGWLLTIRNGWKSSKPEQVKKI